jgi:hypothetical protein
MTTRRSRSVAPLMSLVAIVLVVAGCTAGGPIASVSPASSPTAAPDTACIDIAMYKGFIVDLGELEPGTYTVTAFGDAPALTVTID